MRSRCAFPNYPQEVPVVKKKPQPPGKKPKRPKLKVGDLVEKGDLGLVRIIAVEGGDVRFRQANGETWIGGAESREPVSVEERRRLVARTVYDGVVFGPSSGIRKHYE